MLPLINMLLVVLKLVHVGLDVVKVFIKQKKYQIKLYEMKFGELSVDPDS